MLAYHDRSDGGLLITLLEMAFAGHCGLDIDLSAAGDPIAACFAEELGAVMQIPAGRLGEARKIVERHGLGAHWRELGVPVPGGEVRIRAGREPLYAASRVDLQRRWSEVSFRMQELRDNPECAREEYSRLARRARSWTARAP